MTNQEQLRIPGSGAGRRRLPEQRARGGGRNPTIQEPPPPTGQTEKQACAQITPPLQNDNHCYQS